MGKGFGIAAFVAACIPLAGCATAGAGPTAWTPQIDPSGVNQVQYQQDLDECRSYAASNSEADGNKQAGKKAIRYGALGAGAMAVATIATGGIALLPAMAGAAATTGGVAAGVGAATGKVGGNAKYQSIVANCLAGRGYKVLG